MYNLIDKSIDVLPVYNNIHKCLCFGCGGVGGVGGEWVGGVDMWY